MKRLLTTARMQPLKTCGTALMASSLLFSTGSLAAVSDATVEKLMRQVEILNQRVKELEAADESIRSETVALKEASSSVTRISDKLAWAEKVKVKGDFRYRYENIDDENKPKDRNRSRVRARIEAQAQVNDTWKVGLGLASGSDDPVSTNQTLGGGGSSKGINLDMAYFDWSGIENTHVIGGKFKNPFYKPAKNGLIWDGDYRPEGLAFKYDNGQFFANAAFMYLESDDKAGSKDAESFWGTQLGFNAALSDNVEFIGGVSYYDIPVMGSTPFFDSSDSFGNTLALDGTYQNNYEELELFAELKTKVADLPFSVFVDWVENQDADDNETGLSAGLKLGKAKNPGTWQMAYIYQDLEADAVLGLTTDSDFGGGGTDSKGHIFKGGYAINKNTSFAVTYFINENGDAETDYDRLQVDLKFKY
ncbi:MAG: putative porin [Porticoccaceae bacterium]|nr:putative porin [Porticoccaceae bacterium]